MHSDIQYSMYVHEYHNYSLYTVNYRINVWLCKFISFNPSSPSVLIRDKNKRESTSMVY